MANRNLVASVVDIIENEKQIAILDTSSEAHMPDTIIMPYTSEVLNARILATRENEKISDLKENEFFLFTNRKYLFSR